MNPPPLAKRIVLLTATISLLTSCAVLFVAIPKGIDEYVERAESTTTVPLVKGNAVAQMGTLTVGNITSCAINYGNGRWVASSDRLGDASTGYVSTAGAESIKVRLFRSASEPYLVLASATSDFEVPGGDFAGKFPNPRQLSMATVTDCLNNQSMSVKPTPTQFADENEMPVYVDGDINGLAIVTSADNQIIGFVCEHDHSQWFLPLRAFGDLFNTAR